MDKYQRTFAALKRGHRGGAVGGKNHGMDDTYWDILNPREWLMGGKRVVWRKDSRRFLTAVHNTGYENDGVSKLKLALEVIDRVSKNKGLHKLENNVKLRKAVPLAAVENVTRKYRPVNAKEHSLAIRALAKIPFLRDFILFRRYHILYSAEAAAQHRRITLWCQSMRDLADQHDAYTENQQQRLLQEAKAGKDKAKEKDRPKRGRGADKERVGVTKDGTIPKRSSDAANPEAGDASAGTGADAAAGVRQNPTGPNPRAKAVLQGAGRGFEMIPREVFFQTLVLESRHRHRTDVVRVLALIIFILLIAGNAFTSDWDRVMYARAVVYFYMQKLTGGDLSTEAFGDYLCNRVFYPCRPHESLAPEDSPKGMPRHLVATRHGRVYAKVLQLTNQNGHRVTIVPLPAWADEGYYWRAARILRACAAVGISQYQPQCQARDMHEVLFFPRDRLALPLLGVNEAFIPLFHGTGDTPELFGTTYRPFFPLAIDLLDTYSALSRGKAGKDCAAAIASRQMMHATIGTALQPGSTPVLCHELFKRGYTRVAQVTELQVVNGHRAAETMLSVYPLLRTLQGSGAADADASAAYPPAIPLVLSAPCDGGDAPAA